MNPVVVNPWMLMGVAAIISFIFAILLFVLKKAYDDKDKMRSDITALQITSAGHTLQLTPLWAKIQSQCSSELHHPNPRYIEMDGLLEKLEALTITDTERRRLKEMLFTRSHDFAEDITDSQRKSATLMILIMDKVLLESANSPATPTA